MSGKHKYVNKAPYMLKAFHLEGMNEETVSSRFNVPIRYTKRILAGDACKTAYNAFVEKYGSTDLRPVTENQKLTYAMRE